jgi:hypothetical protein
MGRLSKEKQIENIDNFTADLLFAVMQEGLQMGIPQDQQEYAQEAIRALGESAKTIVGRVPPTMFASAMITYGHALMESMVSEAVDEAKKEGGRQVYQHVDERVSTDEGDEDE